MTPRRGMDPTDVYHPRQHPGKKPERPFQQFVEVPSLLNGLYSSHTRFSAQGCSLDCLCVLWAFEWSQTSKFYGQGTRLLGALKIASPLQLQYLCRYRTAGLLIPSPPTPWPTAHFLERIYASPFSEVDYDSQVASATARDLTANPLYFVSLSCFSYRNHETIYLRH